MAFTPSHICLFEDLAHGQFLPLVYFRPVYNLRCGILSLKEKMTRRFPRAGVTIHCRPYLAEYMRLRNPLLRVNEIPGSSCLFLNGRLVMDENVLSELTSGSKEDEAFVSGETIVAARVSGKSILHRMATRLGASISLDDFDGLPRREIDARMVSYPWDLVRLNGEEILSDVRLLRKGKKSPVSPSSLRKQGVVLLGEKNVFIGSGASIGPGTVIDATGGPVVIGENVVIQPHVTLMGPLFIGNGSVVKAQAQIHPGTSVGPVCKIGGEMECSIVHGYSNKQHHGFIGHSYIGAWANLGAGTTNSDLKNNYGTVRVQVGTELVDTGRQFVGLTLGDHSKTAINSMFNTGTIVGVCSNIFGFGFPPKHVPSFSWGAAGETFTTFSIDRAIEMASRVMARRNVTLSAVEDSLIRNIFAQTAGERRRLGMPA